MGTLDYEEEIEITKIMNNIRRCNATHAKSNVHLRCERTDNDANMQKR